MSSPNESLSVEIFEQRPPFSAVQAIAPDQTQLEISLFSGPLVSSVFGRTGDVIALQADYAAFYAPIGGGIPPGGAIGQVLTKLSSSPLDAGWENPTVPLANPTALIGLTAINGTALTAMRSDAAPPLDTSITPTWSGQHIFGVSPLVPSPSGSTAAVNKTYVDSALAGVALTKSDDTNVTLTLTGNPTTALLHATQISLGWTGTLGLNRGGLGQSGLSIPPHKYFGNNTGSTTGADFVSINASEISGGAALTRVNDTNVTLTLAGNENTALLAATSLTLGWTGTLGLNRGGLGQSGLSVAAHNYFGNNTGGTTGASFHQPSVADLSDGSTGTGSVVLSVSPALTGSPTAPTQSANDNSTKLATTAYVDTALASFDIKPDVAYASTTALPSNTYSNGSSGVGATLTGTANGPLVIDGITLVIGAVGTRILVAGEAASANNGWYTLTQLGVIAVSPYILTRAVESDQAAEIGAGYLTGVVAPNTLTPGSSNNGKVFISIAADPFTVGSTSLTFSQVGGTYSAGTGLSLSGSTFAIDTATTVDKTTAQVLTNKDLTSGTNTFPTLNQNTTGSAASLSISGQTGLLTFTGLSSTNRIKTVRDAADTILELGGSYTTTGTWTSLTMVTPVLGTPTSGTLTNCTGLPITGLVASTSAALGVGTIELGHASDTTIARSGAGAITVEGVAVLLSGGALGTPSSGTLTNCTFPTLNQNTTGSASSLSISGQTGLLTVTGLTSTNRIKTIRDAADTILELGGSYTPTGTWTSFTMVTPVLGTPTSGVLTNCTGTADGLTAGDVTRNHAIYAGASPPTVDVGLFTISKTGVNLKAAGTTAVFTVPTGRTFICVGAYAVVTSVTTPGAGTQTFQIKESAANGIMTSGAASGSGTPAVGTYYSETATTAQAPFVACAAGNNVNCVVATSHAGSTAVTGTVFVQGFYSA